MNFDDIFSNFLYISKMNLILRGLSDRFDSVSCNNFTGFLLKYTVLQNTPCSKYPRKKYPTFKLFLKIYEKYHKIKLSK